MVSDRFSLNGSSSNKPKLTLTERDRAADAALSTRYDALNQLFTEAERHLKSLKPLYPIWVDYNHDLCDGQPDRWELLGLTKHGDKWRLCHAYDEDVNEYGYQELKPIVECAVDVRVRAAKVIRRLYEKIVKSKEEYIPQVDEAIQELTDLCKEI